MASPALRMVVAAAAVPTDSTAPSSAPSAAALLVGNLGNHMAPSSAGAGRMLRGGGLAQCLLRALELFQRLFELLQLLPLAIDDLGLGLGEEVLVAQLALRALEVVEQPVGLARETGPLRLHVDQTFQGQEDFRAADHRRRRDRGARSVVRQSQPF